MLKGRVTADEILTPLPRGRVDATRQYGKADDKSIIRPGKLRRKRRKRVAYRRPVRELDAGRFAAMDRRLGSWTLNDEEDVRGASMTRAPAVSGVVADDPMPRFFGA